MIDDASGDRDPYATPQSRIGSQALLEQDFDEEAVRAFVGSKADYYLRRWAPLLEGKTWGAGFNWAAFFLTGLWLPYRKMYKITAIFLGFWVVESLGEELFFQSSFARPGAVGQWQFDVGLNLVVSALFGLLANRLYLSHVRHAVAVAALEGLEGDERSTSLAKRGQTSLFSALLFQGGFVALLAVAFLLLPDTT